jgi:helicase
MIESKIEPILEKLQRILDKDSGDIAHVIQILGKEEVKYLKRKLNVLVEPSHSENYYADIHIKAESIDTLITFLLNHSKLKEIFHENETSRNEFILNLHDISYELRKVYFAYLKDNQLPDRLYNLIMAVCNGILADRVSDVDLFARKNVTGIEILMENLSPIDDLKNRIYLIILLLVKRIANLKDKDILEQEISACEKLLVSLQQKEMEGNNFEISNGILIGGFANLLFVLKSVFNYLISGKTEGGESIDTLIKTYTFNAFKLFENSHEDIASLSNLVNYALERICSNSIWKQAQRAPTNIKRFLEHCAQSIDNIILSFLPSQRKYIPDLMTARQSIVINMPTSAGKTFLAEIYIIFTMQAFVEISGNEIIKPTVCYVVPTNALLNQTKKKFESEFKDLGYRIECALPYYEVDEIEEEILKKQHIDILISTPEKLDFLVRRDHPSLYRLKLVVVDEAHMIADKTRGAKLELLLAILKQKRKDVHFLLMSPFIKNARQISRWLGDTDADSAAISIEWTPTKQYVAACIDNNKKEKTEVIYFPTPTNNIIEDEVKIDLGAYSKTLKEKLNLSPGDSFRAKSLILLERYFDIGNFMILCPGPPTAQEMAKLCLDYFRTRLEIKTTPGIEKVIALIELESGKDDPLIECVRYGVVYHHARLYNPIKEAIEELISGGDVKIVCATTTLAQGMNFPITSIFFAALSLGGGKDKRKMNPDEFWNIAGRAGRTFKDSEGHIISTNQDKQIIHQYIKNKTVEVLSSLGSFFESIDEHAEFGLKLIKNQRAASDFLQYLNHILRVAYKYDLDKVDTARLRNILNTSLAFKEMEFQSGFLESQEKIRRFSHDYIQHMKSKSKGTLAQADMNCLSDISYSMFYASVKDFVEKQKSEYGNRYKDDLVKASKIILEQKSVELLSPIIEIIARIPEMQLYITGEGRLQPGEIAKIVISWVDGKNIRDIADEVKYEGVEAEVFLDKCIQYINSRFTTFLPWGMSAYQKLTKDEGTEAADNLPSYIYYGVNSNDLVILSRLGIPRFAVLQVKNILNQKHPALPLAVDTMDEIKARVRSLNPEDYHFPIPSTTVKQIIDSSL